MLTFAVLKLYKMEKEFIPYEQAFALKELEFDEPCFAQYKKYDVGEATLDIGFSKNEIIMQFHKLSKFCSAPTFSQAFRWFREVYNIYVEISFNQKYENPRFGYIVRTKSSCLHTRDFPYKTYEEAELECLKKLIEIVKEK